MKRVLLAVLFLFTISTLSHAQKAKFAAGEITYEHIADSTYIFYANLYLDCAGGQEPSTVHICFNDPCNSSYSFTATLTKTSSRGNVAQMGCSQYPTNCSDPDAIRGYRIWHYAATITLPDQCDPWHISVATDTTTISQNLQPSKFFIEITFNNTGTNKNNSSLFFIDDAIAYCGEGTPYAFRSNPVDPDGDSLVTEITAPLTVDSLCSDTPKPVTARLLTPRISLVTNPFPTSNTFIFDRSTGNMSFTPSTAGTAIIALKIYEYRNGLLLGTTIRNQVIHMMPAPIRGEPLGDFSNIGYLYNCTYQGGRFIAHVNDSFSVQIGTSTSRSDGKLMLYDNCDSVLPNAKVIYTGQYSKSVLATLTYTPALSDTGLCYVLFKIVDTTCDPPGFVYSGWGTMPIFIDATPSVVHSILKEGSLKLYPNPTSGQFTITGLDSMPDAAAEITNIMGQVVYRDMITAKGKITLPANISDGLYQVKISSQGHTYNLRLVLKR